MLVAGLFSTSQLARKCSVLSKPSPLAPFPVPVLRIEPVLRWASAPTLSNIGSFASCPLPCFGYRVGVLGVLLSVTVCQVFGFLLGLAVIRISLDCLEFAVFLSRPQACATMPRSPLWLHCKAELPWCRKKAHIRVGMPVGFCSFLNHQRISLDTDVLWNFIYFGNHLDRSLALVESRHYFYYEI